MRIFVYGRLLTDHISHLQNRPYLSSADRIKRLKAIDLLFNLVLNIKPVGFKESEVHYLTEFFIGRLSDSFLIPCEVSQTLHLLVSKWRIKDELVKRLCIAIRQVEMAQQSSEIRFHFYKILGHLLKHYLAAVQSFAGEYTLIFLQSVEGEKDPRCLLLVFDLFVFLNQNLDTSSYEDDLFEVVSCYFPIMYNPPKEVNKLHITKENLSAKLLVCLTCNKQFAVFLIHLLIDKFESPLEEVKIYCYQALNRILEDADDFKLYASPMADFWSILKFDCLKKRSKATMEIHGHVERCLKLLTRVYALNDDLIRKWFKMILNDLEACLFNLDLNCYLPSTQTLSAVSSVYTRYFTTISRLIIANAIHNYNANEHNSKRRVEALQSLYVFGEEIDKERDEFELDADEFNDHQTLLSKISLEKIALLKAQEDLESVFDHVICFLFKLPQANVEDDERLNGLITLKRLLSLDILDLDLTKYLNELFKLIKNYREPKYSAELFTTLEHFNQNNCDLVQQSLTPGILAELTSSSSPIYFVKLLQFCCRSLSLEQEKQFVGYSLDCFRSERTPADLIESICSTLKCHIQTGRTNAPFLGLFFDGLLQPLVDRLLKQACDNRTAVANQESMFGLISEVCRHLDDEKAKQIQTFIFVLFSSESKVPSKSCFLNFSVSLDSDNLLLLKLMESMLRGLRISGQDRAELRLVYTKLFDKLIVTKDLAVFQTLINLIEICTAKFEQTKPIVSSLAYVNDVYQDQALRVRYLLVKFYASIVKAFLTIGSDQCQAIVKKLIAVLMKEKNLDICKQVVIGIKYIHDPDEKLLTEANHVRCKSFLNQRFYYLIIPLLLKEYNYLESEDALNDLTLIESEEQSKDEYRKLTRSESESSASTSKRAYSRRDTDSFVVKMITNIESKIAAEKENEGQMSNGSPANAKKPKIMADGVDDPVKHTLNLRKNLISNAIILQINYLPKAMIKIELKKLQKIIVQNSLNLNILSDCDVLVNNQIDFLKLILEFNSKLLEDKIVNLVNFLCQYLGLNGTNMHVRCQILNCLELMASNLNPVELIKFKLDIIGQLRAMLDHKKRLVRYAAVSAINKWVTLGQPV